MLVPRRFRKSAPKTKTGCKTCRIRRVKCDEQIPVCQRCYSTGRKCDGYDIIAVNPTINRPVCKMAPKSRSFSPEERVFGEHNIEIFSYWWRGPLLITQLGDEVEERRLFHTFRTVTSGHFTGKSSNGFWSGLVLQACHVNSSIRHAAIALASLHEGFLSQHCNGNQSEKVSFQHYGQALEGTRKSLMLKDQPIIVTIIICILLSYFESFRGELVNAIMHLRSGLDILSSHITTIDSTALRSISHTLTQTGFQVNYFVDNTNHAQLVEQLQSLHVPQLSPIPTFEELQASLYSCLNGSMFSGQKSDSIVDLASLGTNYHMTECAQLILSGSNSPSFVRGRKLAISNLDQWQIVFNNYSQTQDKAEMDLNRRALTLLKLHHLVATMMLSPENNSSIEQAHSKSAVKNFKQIINWSMFLLVGKSALPSLLPDVGIIAPLFFVATKGPDSILRDQAKEILASDHRREGIWDSKIAVKIITAHHTTENRNGLLHFTGTKDRPTFLSA